MSDFTPFSDMAKVRYLWLKKKFPDLRGMPYFSDSRLKLYAGFGHAFDPFLESGFDYNLFNEMREIVQTGQGIDRNVFMNDCLTFSRRYKFKDALFYYGDFKYGKEFNVASYEWYKYAALLGSPCAAYRLHSILQAQMFKPNTIGLDADRALRIWENNYGKVGIAVGESAAWRNYGDALVNESHDRNQTSTELLEIAGASPIYFPDDYHALPILRMINEARREQLEKEEGSR
jgi:hypothetical protein